MWRLIVVFCLISPVAAHAVDIAPRQISPVVTMMDYLKPVQGFDCSDRSCKALSSCEEACHKLLVCGQSKRDGDNDGIPCENLCRRRC